MFGSVSVLCCAFCHSGRYSAVVARRCVIFRFINIIVCTRAVILLTALSCRSIFHKIISMRPEWPPWPPPCCHLVMPLRQMNFCSKLPFTKSDVAFDISSTHWLRLAWNLRELLWCITDTMFYRTRWHGAKCDKLFSWRSLPTKDKWKLTVTLSILSLLPFFSFTHNN